VSDALTIRAVTPADFAQWLPLWVGYHRFYGRAVADDVTRTTWRRIFDAYEPVHGLVADAEGELLGLAHFIFHRNTATLGPVTYMQDLFTAEAARRRGVGRALIEAVYERARTAGSPRVYWLTHETNATAQALYDAVADRSGFIQYRKAL
jgi:GNAT superfamily N-acetyltransferase